jgi:hypothetical protein
VLDDTAARDIPYRYTAIRRVQVQDEGRTLEMRSVPSVPAEITLEAIYPPEVPTSLTAAGFSPTQTSTAAPGGFAVDLVWQPVEDADLAGYNVYRQPLGPTGSPVGERVRLNPGTVPQAAFHDDSASAAGRYRYSVTAVDTEGNESQPTTTTVQPSE